MALEVDRKQALGAVILLSLVGAGAFWFLWRGPKETHAAELQTTLDSLTTKINIAKRDLARGTVEDLRRKIAEYQGSLALMRQLVPANNEVPSLIDDIRARAGQRDVKIGELAPLAVEPGTPFDTHQYRVTVFGHYDAIGEFLTDVASLPRIMVPGDVTIGVAQQPAQQAYSDTTGALLETQFQIRTFVKAQAGSGGSSGQP